MARERDPAMAGFYDDAAVGEAYSSFELLQQVTSQVHKYLDVYLTRLMVRAARQSRSRGLGKWMRRVRKVMRRYSRVAEQLSAKERPIRLLLLSEYLRPQVDKLEQEIRDGVEVFERRSEMDLTRESLTRAVIQRHQDRLEESLDRLESLVTELRVIVRSYEL
jgi:hypothetical protein